MTAAILSLKSAFRMAVHDAGGIDACGALIGRSAQQVARYYDPGSPDTPTVRVAALVEAAGPSLHVTRALATLRGAAVVEAAREIPHAPMGISKDAVLGRVHRLGLVSRPSPLANATVDQARKDAIAADVRAGLTVPRIAQRLGLSRSQIRYTLTQLGLSTQAAATAQARRAAQPGPRHPVSLQRTRPRALRRAARTICAEAPATARAPLASGGCRWPLWGDERPTQRFCNAARRDLACPYCPTHAARAFATEKPKEAA